MDVWNDQPLYVRVKPLVSSHYIIGDNPLSDV